MMVPGTLRTVNANWFSDPQSLRRFSVSLPAGSYTAEFLDENEVLSWPTFVEDHWNKEPDCAGFASFDDVTILKPADFDCDELVRNGGLDSDFNTTEPYFVSSLLLITYCAHPFLYPTWQINTCHCSCHYQSRFTAAYSL